jgi:hypothetical protein
VTKCKRGTALFGTSSGTVSASQGINTQGWGGQRQPCYSKAILCIPTEKQLLHTPTTEKGKRSKWLQPREPWVYPQSPTLPCETPVSIPFLCGSWHLSLFSLVRIISMPVLGSKSKNEILGSIHFRINYNCLDCCIFKLQIKVTPKRKLGSS